VLVHVSRDGQRRQTFENALRFIAPEMEVLAFPAWDCQPYDRVSPTSGITAQRMTALARLARSRTSEERPRILSTTVNALVQRVPPRARIGAETFSAAPGNVVKTDTLVAWLETNGFTRTGTVREAGEYAVRGGIVDLYAPGLPVPVRLDFFGDTLESIRSFDPETQRSVGQMRSLDLVPMSEIQLTTESIRRFRQAYVAAFGAPRRDDRLYEAVSEGRRYPGMEHWLPLFQDRLDTLLDYVPDVPVIFDALVEDAAGERLAQVKDYFDARASSVGAADASATPYRPLKPDALYFGPEEWAKRVGDLPLARLTPVRAAFNRRAAGRRCRCATWPRLHRRAHRPERQCLSGGRRPHPGPEGPGQARPRRRLVRGLARAALPRARGSRARRKQGGAALRRRDGPAEG
jgi:transcription-repair coupling factor (superfamily II helicase)